MNGYRITFASATEINGKWSHNNFRTIIIEAENRDLAEKTAQWRLKPRGRQELSNESVYDVSAETIYRVEYLGEVRYKIKKYYSEEPKDEYPVARQEA